MNPLHRDTWIMPRLRSLLYKLVQLAYTLRLLLGDGIGYVRLCLRSLAARAAEKLCRRKHLALYQERQAKPQRVINTTRIALVWLSRWFDWYHALVIMHIPHLRNCASSTFFLMAF